MAILAQQSIQQDQIKLRWQEPYVSAALNNKNYKTVPRGVYRGFIVSPGGGALEITVGTGGTEALAGYEEGNYDPASLKGWSVAIHEDYDGRSATIIMQDGVNSNYTFDMSGLLGQTVYVVLAVQYILGFPTAGQIKVIDAMELDANPTMLVLAKVEVPGTGPITNSHVITNDPIYPVVRPFANSQKYGYMSASQAEILEILSSVPAGASPTYEVEYVVTIDGPQTITIPGGNQFTVAGNDLIVYKNGVKMFRGRDYTEINTTQISWINALKIEDRIIFRGQMYAVSLTNDLAVQDEGALVSSNVTRINFVGNGVIAIPDGAGRVRVIIPTSGAGGSSSSKLKLNSTGSTIPQARVVVLQNDGTITLFNPATDSRIPYGITSGAIADGEYGTVVTSGFAINALLGIPGISSGDVLYVAGDGSGLLVTTPPDPLVSYVWKFGVADCADSSASGSPVDVSIQIQQLC
jgi:hypothetical protein